MRLYKFNPFYWFVFLFAKIFKRKRLSLELQKQDVQNVFCDCSNFTVSWMIFIISLLALVGILLFIIDEVIKWLS